MQLLQKETECMLVKHFTTNNLFITVTFNKFMKIISENEIKLFQTNLLLVYEILRIFVAGKVA